MRYDIKLACLNVFFFFQAEDGIRVRNVTGVQTCALPILDACPQQYFPDREWRRGDGALLLRLSVRSEERRVGKECRSRWSHVLLKKNINMNVVSDNEI